MNIEKSLWSSNGDAIVFSVPFTKVNREKRTVSGFATLDNIDQTGDLVTAEASLKAFENFRGNIREMHGSSAVGKMLSFRPETFYDPATKEFYNGVYVDAYVSKNIKSEDQKYLFALIDEFISMIVKSENVNSIDQVNDEIIEKYFSDHLDSGSMISMDGKNHSQICGLFREMAVNSYKLTEYVMTNKLGFVPIPGYYDGNVDV